jgi:MFS family permease
VSFSFAGSLSDIFGRRYMIITGNSLTLIGAV